MGIAPKQQDRTVINFGKLSRRPDAANRKGFTVIELAVTLAVIGILVKIALPNFLVWLPVLKLSGAARQIATDLQLAREQAIATNASKTVTFNTSAGSYTFGSESRSVPSLFPGIMISAASSPTFTPRGTANSVTITLSDGTNQKLVCVKTMGRVVVRDSSCT
jgi:prepilin-type N-terminal cleavage/methylation domain-containing protein